MTNNNIDDTVATGETVSAVLKRDGKTIQVIGGKTPEQADAELPDRYEITLKIRDRLTGEIRKYEVKE